MEINFDKEGLEKAFNNSVDKKEEKHKECKCHPGNECKCTNEEEIGYHKGSLNTLIAERNELVKMIGNVEMIMGMHLKKLEELGVKTKKDGCPDC
jgi:hypothetical protein